MSNKTKVLIFHQWLAPYRVDQFNSLSELFDLEVVYLFSNISYDNFNQKLLKQQCRFNISYLLRGPEHKSRVFRFGIYKKIKETNPNIILSYEYSFTTLYLVLLKSLGLIKQDIGSLIDDSLDICYNPRSFLRSLSRQVSVKHLRFLVLLSHKVKAFYEKNFNLSSNRIIVSPILQIPDKLRYKKEELETIAKQYQIKYSLYNKKVLLFVGRVSPEKALPEFLRSIIDVIKSDDNLVLIIVGTGSDTSIIEDLIRKNYISDKVIFTGRYEFNELYAWYLCASGLVLPSISETFGAVVNEALIFGKKVLCSSLAGASTLITERNGTIFNPLDKNDTVNKTKEFISSIEPVTEIDLAKSPSLMETHLDDYLDEWKKLDTPIKSIKQ